MGPSRSFSFFSQAAEIVLTILGASLIFGVLFIVLIPLYLLIARALRKSWNLAIDPQTRIVPRDRWWFFRSGLHRYLWTRSVQLIATGYVVGGCWLAVIGYRERHSPNDISEFHLVLLFLQLLFSLLVVALTFFGGLLSRVRNHLIRLIAGIIASCFFHALCLAFCWLLAVIFPPLGDIGQGSGRVSAMIASTALFMPLSVCTTIWMLWISRGDAWFRLREE